MFPTPPSLEQHPAFSPIMTYRDTPSQEPPASNGPGEHLPLVPAPQTSEHRMDTSEGMMSPGHEDVKVMHILIYYFKAVNSYIVIYFTHKTCTLTFYGVFLHP